MIKIGNAPCSWGVELADDPRNPNWRKVLEENASGDGQYDAFLNAIRKMYKKKKRQLPQLVDYAVHIPPGSHSDALCETSITWLLDEKEFITRGLDSDQTVSAIKATEKMLNSIAQ